MDSTLAQALKEEFVWLPEAGLGYYPVKSEAIYDSNYFWNYRKLSQTEMGSKITQARIDFVAKHFGAGILCDVGIGSGHFVEERSKKGLVTMGYDINPVGVEWLKERNRFCDPYKEEGIRALTFWDSLEHIADPSKIFKDAEWIFCSLPIFKSCEHVLGSKHFKKNEHCWYFTTMGFLNWMYKVWGFQNIEIADFETELGREGIRTFAFKRA